MQDVHAGSIEMSSKVLPCPLQLSGERVLTMDWMEGCKLQDLEALQAMHIHPRDVALEMLHVFAQMVFVDGFGARCPLSGSVGAVHAPYSCIMCTWQAPQCCVLVCSSFGK